MKPVLLAFTGMMMKMSWVELVRVIKWQTAWRMEGD
jgi:hypothetical protein